MGTLQWKYVEIGQLVWKLSKTSLLKEWSREKSLAGLDHELADFWMLDQWITASLDEAAPTSVFNRSQIASFWHALIGGAPYLVDFLATAPQHIVRQPPPPSPLSLASRPRGKSL